MHSERCVDDRICMSSDSAYIGWLWWSAFSRFVQQPHAVIAKLNIRIVVSLTGTLYAVIAGDLYSIFADAAASSGMW